MAGVKLRFLGTLLGGLTLAFTARGSELKSGERLIFFPTLGRRVTNGWELDIHGRVFEPEKRKLLQSVFRRAVGLDEGELRASEKAIFKERSQLFLIDNERGKTFSIQLGGRTNTLDASAPNGHFSSRLLLNDGEFEQLRLSAGGTNGLLAFHVCFGAGPSRPIVGSIHLLEESGLSVISDIDDTIKISDVRKKKEMLRNTFCRPFKPVPGMAAVYQFWVKSADARFHYVSASPWQLYPPLAEFVRTNGFPAGSFHLKNFRVKDQTFWGLFASPEKYKRGVIEPMLAQFPKRRFVLVGDSGEKDPEIYGAIARRHPQQIERIFIRNVTGETAESKRLQKAFAGLPKDRWKVFNEPAEIQNALPECPWK